ncbi:hypothetical protein GH714_013203 [Hevea brasiliensis]|nr:hypothetical protein GH714_013203 [Hevea brasiliensis]
MVASSTVAQEGLQRQGSLTLPRTISQKTVDEVWKDISKEYGNGAVTGAVNLPQRQQTLGEITLEEFLVRAGVVREDAQLAAKLNANGSFFGDLSRSGNNSALGIGFQQNRGLGLNNNNTNQISMHSSNLPFNVNGVRSYQAQGISGGLMQGGALGMVGLGGVATGSPANQLSSDGITKSNGDTSSVSPVPYVFNGGLRGRRATGAVEKVVERRQRRMIKNRESAARSRARKQAYTMELEAEVEKIKEENRKLQKKQAEVMEMQKNQVMEMMNQQQGVKKRCLRRTQTGPW